jgi:type IV pilus secretin PilQ/predicted competence protein
MKPIQTFLICFFFCSGLVGFAAAQGGPDLLAESSPVNLDLQDTDIQVALRSISDICRVSIVPASNVKGKINVTLYDVPLKDALDAIVTSNGYTWEQKGKVIYVRPLPSKVVEPVQLKYAEAEVLQQTLQPMLSDSTSIIVDGRSNKLIIRDYPEQIEQLKRIIDEFDIPSRQVTINAKIIDINVSDAIDLGLNLGFTTYDGDPDGDPKEISRSFTLHEGEDGEIVTGRNTDYTSEKARSKEYGFDLLDDSSGNLNFGYDNYRNNERTVTDITSLGTLTTSVINAALSDVISVKLDALITQGRSLLLASPTITTLNNQTASIIIGDKVGIKEQTQTTTGTTETVRFQDVGTKLEVTPIINVDGYITMEIKPEISSIVDYTQDTIQFRTREAQTKVRVKNGQTVIIGGLIKNEETINRKRVPLFSRIPILGIPFRSKYDLGEQTELVVFLTPRILDVEEADAVKLKNTPRSKRVEEAAAKEEELIKKFTYGYHWGKKPESEINEEKSLAKKLYKEALRMERKARRIRDDERANRMNALAIEKYEQVVENYPGDPHVPDSLYHMARIRVQSGENALARILLDRILEEHPHRNVYRKARKLKKKIGEY